MEDMQWLAEYFAQYRELLFGTDVRQQLVALKTRICSARAKGKKMIIAGNGGSAAIASHCAVDFTKNAGIRCVNFNEADLITCLANDFGYEWWLQKALEYYAEPGDLALLISSSGKSPNMVNAARYATANGLDVVTLTGFEEGNPLKAIGHLNLWVNSRTYNIIEMTHQMWLLAVCDLMAVEVEQAAPVQSV